MVIDGQCKLATCHQRDTVASFVHRPPVSTCQTADKLSPGYTGPLSTRFTSCMSICFHAKLAIHVNSLSRSFICLSAPHLSLCKYFICLMHSLLSLPVSQVERSWPCSTFRRQLGVHVHSRKCFTAVLRASDVPAVGKFFWSQFKSSTNVCLHFSTQLCSLT